MNEVLTRFKNGIYMATQSFTMLWQQKQLLLYLALPIAFDFVINSLLYCAQNSIPHAPLIAQVVVAFCVTIPLVYLTAALLHHTAHIMQGETTTFSESVTAIKEKFAPIATWICLMILTELAITMLPLLIAQIPYTGWLNVGISIILVLALAAWLFYSFFVLPLIVFNDYTFIDTLKQSGRMVYTFWVQILAGEAWFGIVILIITIPLMLIMAAPTSVTCSLGIVVFICRLIARWAILTAHAIFKVILYKEYTKNYPDIEEIEALNFPKYF